MNIVIYVSMFVSKKDQKLLSSFAREYARKLKVKYAFTGKTRNLTNLIKILSKQTLFKNKVLNNNPDLKNCTEDEELSTFFNPNYNKLIFFLFTLISAIALYFLVEKPFLKLRDKKIKE